MNEKISRRSFLKGTVAAATASTVGSFALPSAVKGAAPEELATLIDIRKCIGCEACVEACRDVNEAEYPEPIKPFPKMFPASVQTEDWSERREVRDRLTPYNWLFIQMADVTINGGTTTLTIPRRCMHCQNPPCADLCPWGAARKLKNGTTVIAPDICLGGKKCQVVCPWAIPQRQTGVGLYLDLMPAYAGNGVMYKCHRCHQRIANGEMPACITACPEDVQKIGRRVDILQEARAVAREINGYVYGETENGGTNTFYVSPVPFSELNRAVQQGPGKPHFESVPDMMADADHLAKVMLVAPLAGAAGALLKFAGKSKTSHSPKNSANEIRASRNDAPATPEEH